MLNIASYDPPTIKIRVEELGDGLVRFGAFAEAFPLHMQAVHQAIIDGPISEPGEYRVLVRVDKQVWITNEIDEILKFQLA